MSEATSKKQNRFLYLSIPYAQNDRVLAIFFLKIEASSNYKTYFYILPEFIFVLKVLLFIPLVIQGS